MLCFCAKSRGSALFCVDSMGLVETRPKQLASHFWSRIETWRSKEGQTAFQEQRFRLTHTAVYMQAIMFCGHFEFQLYCAKSSFVSELTTTTASNIAIAHSESQVPNPLSIRAELHKQQRQARAIWNGLPPEDEDTKSTSLRNTISLITRTKKSIQTTAGIQ